MDQPLVTLPGSLPVGPLTSLEGLKRRTVRLKLAMEGSKLYALQFAD